MKSGTDEIVGSVGGATLERFVIKYPNFFAMKEGIPEGTYHRLKINGRLYMSDTPAEKHTNYQPCYLSHGRALVAGLGLGMILPQMIERCSHVTVVENNSDVIALIAPRHRSKNLTIVRGDIFTWRPPKGTKYNCIWFDIWPDISTDTVTEMNKLHRSFARFLDRSDDDAWIDSWRCKEMRARRRREAKRWW